MSVIRGDSRTGPARFYAFADQMPHVVDDVLSLENLVVIISVFTAAAAVSAACLALYYRSLPYADQLIEAFVSGDWRHAWMISRAAGWPA